MLGPLCPVHKEHMDWLSTDNQYRFYCKQCGYRYNDEFEIMTNDWNYKEIFHPCGHKCYPGAKPDDWCIECRYGDKPYH